MDWWVKNVGKIIADLAQHASKQEGKVIKVSSATLDGWANGFAQLESENERLREQLKESGSVT